MVGDVAVDGRREPTPVAASCGAAAAAVSSDEGRTELWSCNATGLLSVVVSPLLIISGRGLPRASSILMTCMCVLGPDPAVTQLVAPPY